MPYAAAAGALIGSWLLLPIPVAAALALAGVCLWRPSPALVLAVFVALSAALGTRAVAGLADPPTGTVDAWVTVLEDPRPLASGGIRATVRHEGRRLEAQAFGMAAARLDGLLAGERVRLSGTVRPASSDWHRWRHVAGVLGVTDVGESAPAAPLPGFANRIRHLLADGAESLSDDHRALFSGMVYGDDRNQSPRLADDFRAAGLGHLLVVSGQNVAFVLALASPLLTRMRPGVRLVALLGVLGVFALLTRFEPSVLRAVTMAGVAVTSAALGRPEQGRRTLAWAIAAVLVLDPFLVRSLAFQLSVCATAGLLWITPALVEATAGTAGATPGDRHNRRRATGGDAAAGGRVRHRAAGFPAGQRDRRPGVGPGDDVGTDWRAWRGRGGRLAGLGSSQAHCAAAVVGAQRRHDRRGRSGRGGGDRRGWRDGRRGGVGGGGPAAGDCKEHRSGGGPTARAVSGNKRVRPERSGSRRR